jgi:hypothetical protein
VIARNSVCGTGNASIFKRIIEKKILVSSNLEVPPWPAKRVLTGFSPINRLNGHFISKRSRCSRLAHLSFCGSRSYLAFRCH